jgi:hypothetical protein
MTQTPTVAPTLIRRVGEGRRPELVGLDHAQEGRTLLVFANPDAAEDFRGETGVYSQDEGFSVAAVDLEGLRVILWDFGYELVALRGLNLEGDPPEQLSVFDAEVFVRLLEEGAG